MRARERNSHPPSGYEDSAGEGEFSNPSGSSSAGGDFLLPDLFLPPAIRENLRFEGFL